MNANDFMILEDCKASWRDSAHKSAIEDAKEAGLDPTSKSEPVRAFIAERAAQHYAELEKIGLENIRDLPPR